MKRWMRLALWVWVGVLFVCAPGRGEENPIKFSGVWLTGKASEAELNFRVGRKFAAQFGDDSNVDLSRQLLLQLRAKAKAGGKRLVDVLAPDDYSPNARLGRALVMACALNYEHVDSVWVGGIRKLIAEVGFDLLICDFSERSVVVSLPGRVMRTDVTKGALTEAKKAELLDRLYRKELVEHFAKLAESRGPEMLGIKTAAVTKVTFFDEARKTFPDWLNRRAEEYYANFVGSNFYEGAGLAMLPYSRGNEVVYCAMRENLADAGRLAENSQKEAGNEGTTFVLKKPDYEVELVIPGVQTVTAQTTETGRLVLNCAYARITLRKGDEVLYSEKHDANVKNFILSGSPPSTPWLAYSDATQNLFFEAAKQLRKRNSPGIRRLFLECAPWTLTKS